MPMENWGVKVMSIGFLVDPMQAVIWRGPMVSGAVKQFMSDVDWGELDYLVIDLPPGTGDIQLTLVQTIPLTGAVIVTTPQDISLADALQGVEDVREGQRAGPRHRREHELLRLFALRPPGRDLRQRRRAQGGGRARRPVPRRDPALHVTSGSAATRGSRSSADDAAPVQAEVIRTIARNMAAQVSIRNAARAGAPAVDIQLL